MVRAKLGRADSHAPEPVPFCCRKRALDLAECLFRAARHGQAAEGPNHARARHQRDNLVAGEHQRRQVVTVAHQVADTGLALYRHAGRLQVGDVTVEGPLRHFHAPGQLRRGGQPPVPEVLDDPEQAVCASHVVSP